MHNKTLNYTTYLILLLTIVLGCGGKKTGKVTSQSPDKKILVTITGTKPNFADPFKTTIIFEAEGKKDAVETEIYANELNEENVKVDWASSADCKITIDQQDGNQRKFNLHYDAEGLELVEQQ
ncbi:MAG TPA: hypothetical protein VF691_06365 [Cytophagaceae bacterium]